jgi:hypothetical protein
MENSYAVIDAFGAVENIINWDGKPRWEPAESSTVVAIPEGSSVGIGWTYINGGFIGPPGLKPNLEG